jgi:hypothetical protein
MRRRIDHHRARKLSWQLLQLLAVGPKAALS